ncbi:TPA: sugar kinase [Candidatus Poribacteria bacterium]|nr:sugar kinase [Candidatus Poribacteria bacterium]HEX29944.1 sugar kinase [Candidatus Poribacteria bacterium]
MRWKMDVICLGIFVADVLAKPITKIPDRGKLELFDEMELHTGGCANNTAIGLARLGISAGAMGKVGEDGFGDFVINNLRRNGVDTRGIRRTDEANTSLTFVMIAPDGERSFLHYIGANGTIKPEDIDFGLIGESRILHIGGFFLMPGFDGEPTVQVLKKAKEMGVTISLDTAWDSRGNWMKLLEPCLPYVDIFLPSIEEAKMLSGKEDPEEISLFFLDYGIEIVGLKMGEEGSYVRTRDETVREPAYKVNVVDATGAGDAFVAGFLAGYIMGWDLKRCVRLANATGAACVTAIGTTAGIRDLDQVLSIIPGPKDRH